MANPIHYFLLRVALSLPIHPTTTPSPSRRAFPRRRLHPTLPPPDAFPREVEADAGPVSSELRRRRRPDPALRRQPPAKAAGAGASSSEEAGAGDDAQAGLAANLGLDGAAATAIAGLLPGLLQQRASEHLQCHRRRCLQAKARHLFLSVAAGGSST
ncbi:hypothetical protein PVAP13_4NG046186 [Panicum virgatum]|uniref:Uncharacterized protein n=1 Tax=Panicum virgatum TaxID=38727 RepID=A0A8T0TAD7_PANVG|nr:hypothetical protein PVAP13_4NG046186 [Panicum virgatum]